MTSDLKRNIESMQCPICDKDSSELISDSRDYFVKEGNSSIYGVRYCEGCGIGFSVPYLSDVVLSEFYPENYGSFTKKNFFLNYLQLTKYRLDLKILESLGLKKGDTLFELGSGRGAFLKAAEQKGFIVSGMEPSSTAIKMAQDEYGILVKKGFASDIRFEHSYSVIVARHVLEHVNNAKGTLEKILKDGLKPGGILFLKVPKLDSWEARFFGKWWGGYDLPRHRIHFTENGITKILSKLGYKAIKVTPEYVPSEIVRSYEFMATYGSSTNVFISTFCRLPKVIKILVAQIISVCLSSRGAGRMIITAQKSK